MSNDDENKKPSKNTSPEHNYKDANNNADGPKGTSGIIRTPPPSLGLGRSTKRVRVYMDFEVKEGADSQAPKKSDEEKRTDYLKSLPEGTTFTAKTGDAEVDKKSLADGDVPVTKEELKSLKAQEAEKQKGPQISQSDYAKAFRQAHGQTNDFQRGKDREIE
ncbi:hypothetical protein [Celeribacter sp.]|uniref:hypothetical protein n=1 Tax=Celeribacter sp. TaxID=1890673 RepID=UPI003A932830